MSEINYLKLPNFLLIGAPKCGTSSLHSILGQNPQIYTTKVKEPHFFERDLYSKGLFWYQENYFQGAENYSARGESTPNYLTMSSLVAPRIKESFGDRPLKFIAIFRDPVKRAYSEYWFRKRRFKEEDTFEAALSAEWQGKRSEWDSIFRGGCYATLLSPFFEHFQKEQFHFILFEELLSDFAGTMKKLTQFLSVADDFIFTTVNENQSYVIKNKKIHMILSKASDPAHQIGKLLTRFLPREKVKELKNLVKISNQFEEKYPPIDSAIQSLLQERYKEETKKLEIIMGRSLSIWSKA